MPLAFEIFINIERFAELFLLGSFQKMERSDSNDIVCTYFRPRRAAELIHQNKVLNFWKDYSNKSNRPINSWMTPSALANNLSSPSAAWQPIPNSAALKSIRNGNVSDHRRVFDDVISKPYYGVRPTSNVLAPNNYNMYKPLKYSHYNKTGDRSLHSMKKALSPAPFPRADVI